jgi:soluble lytic murein transglycosylase-like protein
MELIMSLCLAVSSLGISDSAKKTACDHMPYIVEQSKKAELDPALILSMMYVESRFKKNVVSRSGACGLMQLIPRWNKEKINGKLVRYSCEKIMEPRRNIRLGIMALKRWLKATGSLDRALCGYNAGNICRKKIKYPSKFGYVKAVRRVQRKINKNLAESS